MSAAPVSSGVGRIARMTPQPAPTVGHIVHYHPTPGLVAIVGGEHVAGPYAATVTAVRGDGSVSLMVQRPGRDPIVTIDTVREGEGPGCWSWPPREPVAREPEVLSLEERQALTMWGETVSAQIRDGHLALFVQPGAPRSAEDGHPVILPPADVARLRALFTEMDAR